MSKIEEFLYGSKEKEVVRAISKMIEETDLYEYRGSETNEEFSIIPILSSGYIKEYLKNRLKRFEELDLITEIAGYEKPVDINTGIIKERKPIEVEDYHLKGRFGTYIVYPEEIKYLFVKHMAELGHEDKIKITDGHIYILGELGILELIKKFNGRLDGYIRMIYHVDESLSKVVYEEEILLGEKRLKIKQELPVSGYIGDILAIAFKSCDKKTHVMVIKPERYEVKEKAVKHLEDLIF